ncbi:(2Fe-2S)-binding protein [Gordonia sp. CPCC 205515]|uniref:(2Fe-2S)-binding protein n=1 Tax=Gordonia sp. CPCC 205515 TaxID=3140791 RepID=UPI003AF388D8
MTVHDLAALGPFFAVDTHPVDGTKDAPWQPFSTILETATLTTRVVAVQAALYPGAPSGTVDDRVAASVAHLGLVARVIAPWVASVVMDGQPISRRVEDLWWQDRLGGPFPLSVIWADDRGWEESAIVAVTRAVARTFGVSDLVLGGNVASAANSAARMIALARPELSAAAHAAADEILAEPEVESGVLRSGPGFRRRSCCLIYRVSGDRTAVCGDCVLSS